MTAYGIRYYANGNAMHPANIQIAIRPITFAKHLARYNYSEGFYDLLSDFDQYHIPFTDDKISLADILSDKPHIQLSN
jgi:hypothetical protein